jgi:pyochelin biosynthetic protein PchC
VWLRLYTDPAPAGATLVCCPHAGGAASFFAPWRGLVPADWRLAAVTYPGRENRWGEPPAASLADMARAVAAEIEAAGWSGPVVVFGHSMGAVVAYEVTLALARAGRDVRLVVSGIGPGGSGRAFTARVTDDPATGQRLADELLAVDPDSAAALADPELRAYALGVLSSDLDLLNAHDLSGVVLPGVPVLALGGADDPEAGADALAGWAALTTGPFAQHVFPGGHFYLRAAAADVVRVTLGTVPFVTPGLSS